MIIQEFDHKKVCVLGFGREGQSVVRALEKYAPNCTLTISDASEMINTENYQLSITNYQFNLGSSYLDNLEQYDHIIISPGIPPNSKLETLSSKLTNATQIFLDTAVQKGSTIIGITGSKGKSTTASLLTAILKESGRKTHLIGNIGIPVLDFLEEATPKTYFVQEMSSYQLMYVRTNPSVVIITSFFPDHLDYHGSLKEYHEAKKNICRYQTAEDHVFYADDTAGALEIAEVSPGHKHPYSEQDAPVSLEQTKLIGSHNLRNIAGAWRAAEYLGVDKKDAITAIPSFNGLPHRLQNIGTHYGITWIDDAISTTPESTIAALEALGPKVETIICGGQDRGYDFSELGHVLDASDIKNLILFPDSGEKIRQAVTSADIQSYPAGDMQQAVSLAKELTSPGKICLLSTASPSYNMFKNFEEKGEQFKAAALN